MRLNDLLFIAYKTKINNGATMSTHISHRPNDFEPFTTASLSVHVLQSTSLFLSPLPILKPFSVTLVIFKGPAISVVCASGHPTTFKHTANRRYVYRKNRLRPIQVCDANDLRRANHLHYLHCENHLVCFLFPIQ